MTREAQIGVHERFDVKKSQDFQITEPRRFLRRVSSLPTFANGIVHTSSIQVNYLPTSGPVQPTEPATRDIGVTALENIAGVLGDSASCSASIIPDAAVKIAAAVGLGGLGIGAINTIISACNSHINDKNSKIAKQVADAGDKNIEVAKLVAETAVQNAFTAKIAADASALTAKITAEKWEREKREESAIFLAKDRNFSAEDGLKSNKKDDTRNDDSPGTGSLGDGDGTAHSTSPCIAVSNTSPKEQRLPLTRVRSAPQYRRPQRLSSQVSTALALSAQKETLDGINKMLDSIKAKKASRATPLPGANISRFEAILALEKKRERALNLKLASLRENFSTSSAAFSQSSSSTTSHESGSDNTSAGEILTTSNDSPDNKLTMAEDGIESQDSRTAGINASPPSEIDSEFHVDFDEIQNDTMDIPLQRLNPDHHPSLGIGAEPTSVPTAAPYQVHDYGGRDAVNRVRNEESDTMPDNLRIPRSAIPPAERDFIKHIGTTPGGNGCQDKSEDT
jgi:dsDNA-binding SOS-regulon protein